VKEEILNLSVKYQVLTEETAFIGVIKQDNKVIGELKKVVIPTPVPVREEIAYGSVAYGYATGAAVGGMMKKSAAMPMARSRVV
jgi:hypothetical protein